MPGIAASVIASALAGRLRVPAGPLILAPALLAFGLALAGLYAFIRPA